MEYLKQFENSDYTGNPNFKRHQFWSKIPYTRLTPQADVNELQKGVCASRIEPIEDPHTECTSGDINGYISAEAANQIGVPRLAGDFDAVVIDDPLEPAEESYRVNVEKTDTTERFGPGVERLLEKGGIAVETGLEDFDGGPYTYFLPMREPVDPMDISTGHI